MKHFIWSFIAVLLFLTSCGDDPALVKRKAEQETEIAKLKGEILMIQERLKFLPEDQTVDLANAKVEVQKLEEQHSKLVEEVDNLKKQHSTMQNEYEAYRTKYSVK